MEGGGGEGERQGEGKARGGEGGRINRLNCGCGHEGGGVDRWPYRSISLATPKG